MPKKCYTAQDIKNLMLKQVKELRLQKGDLVTPLARDTARDLGFTIYEAGSQPPAAPPLAAGAPAPAASLEQQVRDAVLRALGQSVPAEPPPAASTGILRADGRSVTMPPFPFDVKRPEMDVRLEDVVTAAHGSPVAAGFMTFHKGSFPWTLTYDEVQYVIEGELHLTTAQGVTIGKPGDVLYVPKGTSLTFGTPSWVKFLYVTYPAEWSG
ncbi:MAG: cupin domain-containing protein [Chloroflexota bacterium]|jgi:ethanolamine utilization protein EutQ